MPPLEMEPQPRTSWLFRMGAGLLIVATVALLSRADNVGGVVVAAVPTVLLILAFAVWNLPLGTSATAALFACLVADNPIENPGLGIYKGPFLPLGEVIYTALEKTTGVPGLKLFGVEAVLIGLGGVAIVRAFLRRGVAGEGRGRAADGFTRALLMSGIGLVVMQVWGLVRGASVMPYSLLQWRPLAALLLFSWLFATAFKSSRDTRLVLVAVVAACVIRHLVGIYYYFGILSLKFYGGTGSGDGTYVTTHSDSVLSAMTVVLFVAWFLSKPTWRVAGASLLVLPVVLYGIQINNRRLAFVSIAFSFASIYLIGNPSIRRMVNKVIALLIPIIFLYIGAGWNSNAGWAKPVQSLKSAADSSEASAQTRDIENYNLIVTLTPNIVLGTGFGQEYVEQVKAYDISQIFKEYRYVPHNSLLGLVAFGGWLGFTLYWSFTAVGALLAVRSYRVARDTSQRVSALGSICAIICFGVQAYGDMGLQSWMSLLVLSAFMGLVANLSVQLGVWHNRDAQPKGVRTA